ncbi:MAG: YdiU family protein [Planktomarina sp.]|nr:YdiU family protein [Planktomarina sp.]
MLANWDNSYAALPPQMFTRQSPVAVAAPQGLILNSEHADELGIIFDDDWPAFMAGNQISQGADPIAQAYAGHQFGHWNPQLGDGRAVLLGEVFGPQGRFDIQLKGAGRTAWSRNGDGRAWYGPVLREYLISEAMHALGIPTTRALAAVATGETILREQGSLPGAVICRTASSHIRVGTFQYFAARDDTLALEALLHQAIARHYREAQTAEQFLSAAVAEQARLIAQWMGVGFIHGVMNTDNSHVGGITIDYGPCAFMDDFVPMKTFSSIDRQGRYAYGNQPNLAAWNMAQLATALLPLTEDRDAGITCFTEIVQGFGDIFDSEYAAVFARKIGLTPNQETDALIDGLLKMMANIGADFTLCFRALATGKIHTHLGTHPDFANWHANWQAAGPAQGELEQVNPSIIPRNHLVEAMIAEAVAGDMQLFHALHRALKTPFLRCDTPRFIAAPSPQEIVKQTFCGT